jgi:hypothetical protein
MEFGLKTLRLASLSAALLAMAVTLPVMAQQPSVSPAKGQTAQQQSADEGACNSLAQQQTGVNPAAVASTPPPAQAQSGQRVKGAAGGAAAGAAIGAIDGNAGHGAAVGAVAGQVAGGVAHRQQNRAAAAANTQAQSAQQQALGTYAQAWAACMQGRGYSVH